MGISPVPIPIPGRDTWEASRDGCRNRAGGGSRDWPFVGVLVLMLVLVLVFGLAVRRDILRR